MARNTLNDLNNHLFEALERLNDDELMENDPGLHIERAKAVSNLGKTIISNARVILDAQKHADEYGYGISRDKKKLPDLLEVNRDD